MPKCPNCRCTFRTLDDETDMHACPRCGYGDRTDEDQDDPDQDDPDQDDDRPDTIE